MKINKNLSSSIKEVPSRRENKLKYNPIKDNNATLNIKYGKWKNQSWFIYYYNLDKTNYEKINFQDLSCWIRLVPAQYVHFAHSPVHSKKNSYFVGIKPQFKREIFKVCVVCKKILPGLEWRLSTVNIRLLFTSNITYGFIYKHILRCTYDILQ